MNETPQKHVNPWVVTVSVMLATFMELLDTTVVNVSLPHISGNLGATVDEGTWVVTSYLVANAIILPMSGWLANHFGRRRLLLACVTGFSASSFLCGISTNLDLLIIARVLQGLTGGGMQPLAQAILLESFPPKKHGQAMAAYGLGILIAPILGPALGGWITDNYNWRWIFYINLPVGALSLFLMSQFVFDPPYIKRRGGGVDLWGIGLLALGIGSLQIVLDTGQRKDWFESDYICFFAVLCVVGLAAMVVRELKTQHPVVDLRALRDRTFSAGVFLIGILGFVLYASLVLLPIYLQTLLGYPAFQAGLAMSPRGVGSLITLPIVGYLTSKIDPRMIIVVGLILGAVTMFDLGGLNLDAGYWDIFWPQVFQGVALGCLFIPLMAVSVSHIPKHQMGNATSIFNLTRNIGGSFGIAVMTTFLSRRTQLHQSHLVEKITTADVKVQQMIAGMTAYFREQGADAYTASQQALGAIYGMVQRHAYMLSFVESFWILGCLFLLMIPLLVVMRRHKHHLPSPRLEPESPRKDEAHEELELVLH